MPFKDQFGFRGMYTDLEPSGVPDGGLIAGTKNVRVKDDVLTCRAGNKLLQAAALLGTPLSTYTHTLIDGTEFLIVGTTTDVYYFDSDTGAFKFLTPTYITGTADCSAGTTVEGTGTDWVTGAIASGDHIKFGTQNPDTAGTPDTWYEIDDVTDLNTLELTGNGPDTTVAVNYVIRLNYAATEAIRWSFTSFYESGEAENLLIATNGVDGPQSWAGGGGDELASISGAPTAKYCGVFGGRLFFGNIVSILGTGVATPYTVIWSPVATFDAWTGGATDDAGYQELYETPGDIKFLAPFGYYMCVGKSDAMILLNASGNATTPFTPNYIIKGRGPAYSTYGLINQNIAFISKDDISLFNGSPNLTSIVDGKIRRAFFSNINNDYKHLVVSKHSERNKEWIITLPSLDAIVNDHSWVYNWEINEWFYDDAGYSTVGSSNYEAGITINELTSAIDSYTQTINSFAPQRAFRDIVYFDSDGYAYIETDILKQLNGVNIEAVAVTKDYIGSDINVKDRFLEMWYVYQETDSASDIIGVQASFDRGVSYNDAQYLTPNIASNRLEERVSWNEVGKMARVMFTGRFFKIFSLKLMFTPQGIR